VFLKITILGIMFSSILFSAPGIDPANPAFSKSKLKKMYAECRKDTTKNKGTTVCKEAMLYEMHMQGNIHKGVSKGIIDSYTGSWLDALGAAKNESSYFPQISDAIDTSLLNSMQSNINSISIGYELSSRLGVLSEHINAYSALMNIVLRETLVGHKIETAITQLLFAEEMAKEIEDFEGKEEANK